MYKRVLETIHTYSLIIDGATIIVGVSGGSDSMSLLDILSRHSKKHAYTLIVAHLHYNIRGAEAKRDRDLVASAAHDYGIPFFEKDLSTSSHPTDEAWLRNTRYTFFEKLRAQNNADSIAVGHTRDDLVETFFLHLLRGSGLCGLRGLAYKRDAIIRPLLDCTHIDTEQYCAQQNITYGIDCTNTDTTYLRNHIRHNLIPYLKDNYNPTIVQTVARTADTVRDDYTELTLHTQHNLPPYTKTNTTLTFKAEAFSALSSSLQRMTLREFAQTLTKIPPPFGTIEQWRFLITSQKNKTQKMQTSTLIMTKNGATVSMTVRT